MLHYISLLFTQGIIIAEDVILTAAIKTQCFANIWKATLTHLLPCNYAPL